MAGLLLGNMEELQHHSLGRHHRDGPLLPKEVAADWRSVDAPWR